jgi:hypothetical protein
MFRIRVSRLGELVVGDALVRVTLNLFQVYTYPLTL